MLRGARPIIDKEIAAAYSEGIYSRIFSTDLYFSLWEEWLTNSNNKTLTGLSDFFYRDYTQGTSQVFDNFVLRHSKNRIIKCFVGDFQYHKCIAKFSKFETLEHNSTRVQNSALLISLPFSDFGDVHPNFFDILDACNEYKVPVCLDLAYWGISQNLSLDLNKYPCIEEVTCSLSKPFYVLENHRVGIRFSRKYMDDGISMLNEVKMYNIKSMELGIFFMSKFNSDFIPNKYKTLQIDVCLKNNLIPTNTVIFGLGGSDYKEHNRGILGNNRVCISDILSKEYNASL